MHICIVAHLAYGALAGTKNAFIGGVERQTSLMARWFASRGYRVSMITWDEGQDDGDEIDGVKVFKLCKPNAGIPGIRFLWPRWNSLTRALKKANADIYYHNCGEYITGQVALWCRRNGRIFVYSAANDTDCDERLPEMHKLRERILYRYGLKVADKIIVQTKKQKEMLITGFERESTIIPMPCPGPTEEDFQCNLSKKMNSNRVLWIGRICEQKRPDRILDIAESNPDLQIDFVGPIGNSNYAAMIHDRIKKLKNVTYHGPVQRTEVDEFYRKAKVMCCTSDFEGFPNTFLEAWSWGVPIISTFDPDHIIAEKGVGIVGTNLTELASGIRELLDSPEKWINASKASREYYAKNHALNVVMVQFEQVFHSII